MKRKGDTKPPTIFLKMKLFNFPITTIFAREVLEGALVIGQFRTVVLRSPEWEDPEKQREGQNSPQQYEVFKSACLKERRFGMVFVLQKCAKETSKDH